MNEKNEKASIEDNKDSSFFTDLRDRKTYKTVRIGNQVWFAENLAYDAGSGCWVGNNNSSEANRCYLYNWETAKKACPEGWRLPTKNDFEILLNHVGGKGNNAYRAFILDGRSGFSAIFNGWYDGNRGFNCKGESANFWSSTEYSSNGAWSLDIINSNKHAALYFNGGCLGFSVRCLQDSTK